MNTVAPLNPLLAKHVAQFCVWPASQTARPVERLPNGSSTIVFRGARAGHAEGDVCVAGAVSQAHYKHAPATALTVSVVFEPGGAYPFLGVPLNELTDEIVPLDRVWSTGAVELLEQLNHCTTGDEAIAVLEAALLERLHAAQDLELSAAMRAARAVRKLAGERLITDVAELAALVGLSARQLRRAFTTAVGVGPKEFLRMLRFQRAAEALSLPGGQLALATGYYDQAHLIAEFQQLARMTPRAFAQRELAAPQWKSRLAVDAGRFRTTGSKKLSAITCKTPSCF